MSNQKLEIIERVILFYLNPVLNHVRNIRALVMKKLISKDAYIYSKSVYPISFKYGFDRGIPIDRFYIEKFLAENNSYIKGRCLEIVDNTYTLKFGMERVTTADTLDIFPTKFANIHGDLRNLKGIIKDNAYDCLIITQTFNVIDDYELAIQECFRVLKFGGTLLVTLPTLSPTWNLNINLWRFTESSCKYIFGKYFGKKNVYVKGYGNPISVQSFWVGLAQEEITKKELESNDSKFPCIVAVRAFKKYDNKTD